MLSFALPAAAVFTVHDLRVVTSYSGPHFGCTVTYAASPCDCGLRLSHGEQFATPGRSPAGRFHLGGMHHGAIP